MDSDRRAPQPRPFGEDRHEGDTAQVTPAYPPVPAVQPANRAGAAAPRDLLWTPARAAEGAPPLGEAEAEEIEPAFRHHRSRILRKLAILRSTVVPPEEPRPSRLGLQRFLEGQHLEHRGDVVAWVTAVLDRDLDAAAPRIRPVERGWFTLEELRLPPPGPAPFDRLPENPTPEELRAAHRWFDGCVASLDPFFQDFLLARDYDGGSWRHVAELLRRSTPACQRFHERARRDLTRLLRRVPHGE
jgi:DNA-directed RNA polymerase specialized sigma24 family protein